MKLNLIIEYDIFDTADGNNLIATKTTLDDAIRVAQENPNYAVDIMIDLQNDYGESVREDGDYLYSMQVYPTVKPYDNYETEIEIKE